MKLRKYGLIAAVLIVLAAAAVMLYLRKAPAGDDDDDTSGPAVAALVHVQTGQLVRTTLHGYVEGYATVAPEPEHGAAPGGAARVTSSVAGQVTKTFVANGDAVQAGAPLFDLDDRSARAALARAQQEDDLARAAVARQRTLLAGENTSARAVQEAEAQAASAEADLTSARVQLGWTHIRSPLTGIVTEVTARTGELIDTTTPLAEIVDPNRQVLTGEIAAADAAALRSGQKVEILSGSAGTGTLEYVSPALDPATGAVRIRISLAAGASRRLGQVIRFRVAVSEHAGVLAAPTASVVTAEDGSSVVSLVANGAAKRVKVTVGLRDRGLAEITGPGLKAGDAVVTVGAYGLPDGAKVQTGR